MQRIAPRRLTWGDDNVTRSRIGLPWPFLAVGSRGKVTGVWTVRTLWFAAHPVCVDWLHILNLLVVGEAYNVHISLIVVTVWLEMERKDSMACSSCTQRRSGQNVDVR